MNALKTTKYLLCVVKEGKVVKLCERKTFGAILRQQDNHPEALIVSESVCIDERADDHGKVYWFNAKLGLMTVEPQAE